MPNEIDISKKDLISNNDEKGLSLSQELANGLEEIKVKKDFQKKIFLLDISGSMNMYIEGRNKIWII